MNNHTAAEVSIRAETTTGTKTTMILGIETTVGGRIASETVSRVRIRTLNVLRVRDDQDQSDAQAL